MRYPPEFGGRNATLLQQYGRTPEQRSVGGAAEIQRNIIAQRVLGLPRR